MRKHVTGIPSFAKKQDIKNWRVWITTVLFFFCMPATIVMIFLLGGFESGTEKLIEASQSRSPLTRRNFAIESTCKSWCERDVSTWNWVSNATKILVGRRKRWSIQFKDTNLLVQNHGGSCCLSTNDMKGYVYGCRWVGKNGEITFNPYMINMVNETVNVLPFAKRAVVLGMGLGGVPQILAGS